MADLELETIRHALEVARRHGFTEVQLELDDASFSAVLPSAARSPSSAVVASADGSHDSPTESGPHLQAITASCVGYYRPSDSLLQVGRKVAKGDIVATITALGLANDVEAPVAGEVVEVLATPEQSVEYGQTLAVLREEP